LRRLIVMRHAQAARAGVSGGDFDRPLTEAGRADARLIGEALKAAGLTPDRAVISAAQRTRETWAEVSRSFPDAVLDVRRELYNAEDLILREAVEDIGDGAETVILIAHNPGVHALAVRLLLEGSAASGVIDKVDNRFPTATAVVFDIDEAERANYGGLFLVAELGGGGRD